VKFSSMTASESWVLTNRGLKRVADEQAADLQLAKEGRPAKEARQSAMEAATQAEPVIPVIDFRAMRREVDAFGAAHLDSKKDKRSFHDRDLLALGFKKPKPARTGVPSPFATMTARMAAPQVRQVLTEVHSACVRTLQP
jgi:Domain of unknown function (DUF4602)